MNGCGLLAWWLEEDKKGESLGQQQTSGCCQNYEIEGLSKVQPGTLTVAGDPYLSTGTAAELATAEKEITEGVWMEENKSLQHPVL